MRTELTQPGPLLNPSGRPAQVGWSRQPLLDCNLEAARFYALRPLQHFRLKRWDYYALFTPQRFFSATIADLGYAGNLFVYTLDFATGALHEEGLVVPLARGVRLPRNSTEGASHFEDAQHKLHFEVVPEGRRVSVAWPSFNGGQGLQAEFLLRCPTDHESMTIVIPIGQQRFYYNRKINCLPAEGQVEYRGQHYTLSPQTCLGSLDWGRGVWEYDSFWVWASSSGFLGDGRRVGLNLGFGFGDTSAATENAVILDGKLHKLGQVDFHYDPKNFMQPWTMKAPDGRLDLVFTPFLDRTAKTDLKLLRSEVHQMFGHYNGTAVTGAGETLQIRDLVGFAEEHNARW